MNDFDVRLWAIFTTNANLYLGNGIITITRPSDYCYYFNYGSIRGTIYCEGSTIKIAPSSYDGAANSLLNSSGQIINKLWIAKTGLNITEFRYGCTINELIIDAGCNVKFSTNTFNIGKLTAIGTQVQPITIGSVTAATHSLVKTGTDVVEVEYCNISNSNATPIDKWSAGETSIDGGNNSG